MLLLGSLGVGLLSFLAAFLWARLRHPALAFFAAVAFPALASWCIYWGSLIGAQDISEHSTWFSAFATFWLFFGWPISIATTLLLRRKLRIRVTQEAQEEKV
jgi:hypothetical protein